MSQSISTDICVIGAGSGGLSVAAGASQMGARVVLVEKHLMGGDCLNFGCVPSKALLAAAHAADTVRHAGRFGVRVAEPTIDGRAVFDHVKNTIAAIAPNDSRERFEGMGVTVLRGAARFVDGQTAMVGDQAVRAKRFVIATGSSAFVPSIEGLSDVPYLTNETVFAREGLPEHLIVVGGGPIGIELAQAHRQLGARVTVLEMFKVMPKDDPELVAVVRRRLDRDGIDIREGVEVVSVAKTAQGIAVTIKAEGNDAVIEGSHILVAAGRRANVAGLDLEKAGVDYGPGGIRVDHRLRTSNKAIFAIGDVAGGYQFTHVAGYHAGIVIRNLLFRLPAKVDYRALPRVTYTRPELAQVGLTEEAARKAHGSDIEILRWPFAENDRAQAEAEIEGLIKVVVTKKGKILGCGIAGPAAGELIAAWGLAIGNGLKIGALAGQIVAYPTLAEVGKRAAGSYFTPRLFNDRVRKFVRFLLRFP